MSRDASELLIPRIALVDDERQIHASIRLRLGKDYELISFGDAREALAAIASQAFDLCIADIHMPHMDGLAFIAAATQADPALGFVVLSAFDTDENLRRAIPLRVYDFLGKPLPEPAMFEARIPVWVERTRQSRRERDLAAQAAAIDRDLHTAQLDREIELVASESARDALLQAASLLTTIHAHFVTACAALTPRAKADPSLASILRNLETGRTTAEAAVAITGKFFDSAYASRDAAPALIKPGLSHAIGIAIRMTRADETNKSVDCAPFEALLPVRGLSGVEFLLMMVPVVAAALLRAAPGTTVGISGESIARLDLVSRQPQRRGFLWANRRQALASHPAVAVNVTATAPAFTRAQAEAWLNGDDPALSTATPRGLVAGLQKSHGLLGIPLSPHAEKFGLVLALPT
ncbi:MAG: response regulator [Opitutaceae bacterium]|nr:response regulator [Opitutaceae bacterium]